MSEASEVLDLANACLSVVKSSVGVELDFTQDTLPVLDHYARLEDPSDDAILHLLAPMLGAYFGEVVRRSLQDARWFSPRGDYSDWRIEFERCFLHFNPVGIAADVLTRGRATGWNGQLEMLGEDRPAVAAALDLFGSVRESDYHRFSVRFEAIEQAHDALIRKAAEAGKSAVFFSAEAYAAATSHPERDH